MVNGKILLAASAAVFALTFILLPAAEGHWFGGHGFGTILAQNGMWTAWHLARRISGGSQPEVWLVNVIWATINTLAFLLVAASIAFAARRHAALQSRLVVGWGVIFGILLLLWPQATYGP